MICLQSLLSGDRQPLANIIGHFPNLQHGRFSDRSQMGNEASMLESSDRNNYEEIGSDDVDVSCSGLAEVFQSGDQIVFCIYGMYYY